MNKEKIFIPIAIVLAAVILSIGYYAVQLQKQQSIERQQMIEIEAETAEKEAQREQEERDYVNERKKECFEIEQSKREIYNNVDHSEYIEFSDQCVIRYLNPKWVEGAPAGTEEYGCRIYEQGPDCSIKKYYSETY